MTSLRDLLRPHVWSARYLRHRFRPKCSYAADREDEAAWLLLGGVRRFIDVGANDGVTCSNTTLFALRGAAGLCFEPDPHNFGRLSGFYRFRRGVECIPEGISNREARLPMRCDGLLSMIPGNEDAGLDALLSSARSNITHLVTIDVRSLAHWLARRPTFASSDLLSIDVEGHELAVLSGIDWKATPKPARCVIVETHASGASGAWRHRDFDAIAQLLAEQRYRETAKSSNNTFWLHESDYCHSRVAEAMRVLPHYGWFSP